MFPMPVLAVEYAKKSALLVIEELYVGAFDVELTSFDYAEIETLLILEY